ncbi:MAG: IS5 family transposase [Sphingobacteriaceae bacterium]|nr:IS5 family transposase [Cytophagaceae bacterium]
MLNDQRQRWHSLRTMTNAILSVLWSGVQWRKLDSAYPPWQSVYYYYRKWKRSGLFEQLLQTLVVAERRRQGRADTPSRLAFDSQSVKIAPFLNQDKGWDGAKRINGRKRHLGVDSLGLPWGLLVTSAQVSDSAAGCHLAHQVAQRVPDLKVVLADHGYKQSFLDHVARQQPTWRVEIVQKPESAQGFVPQKGRWQVERSFGWLNFRRRLSKDFERLVESAQAMLQLAFISFLLPRLAK